MTPDFLPFEEAVTRVLETARRLAGEQVPLVRAARRVLAGPLRTPHDLPLHAASLMDGYAVAAREVAPGKALRVAFELPAGRVAPRALSPGECARIFTGAPLPPGADAVVMQEQARREGERVTFEGCSSAGEHVRQAGSDARAGTELLRAGTVLDAGALALAAAIGLAGVEVVRRPLVGILATGDELRAPGEPLSPGQIHESNTVGLALQAEEAGGVAKVLGLAPDRADAICERLSSVDADVLVTSGGASVGDYDFAREVLARLGGRKLFWQVAIRPGKPVLVGTIERPGRTPQLFFALPGNPGASALTFDLFVRPAILATLGALRVRRPRVAAELAAPLKKPENVTFLARGRLVARDGRLVFEQASLQGSMSILSLHALGAVAIVPAGVARLEAGATVMVEPWGAVEPG